MGSPLVTGLAGHQGGWDEILIVLAPIALFAGLLAIANRRAARALAERRSDPAPAGESPAPAGESPAPAGESTADVGDGETSA